MFKFFKSGYNSAIKLISLVGGECTLRNWQSVSLVIVMALMLIVGLLFVPEKEQAEAEAGDYFRIHIRANSNLDGDQRVKYAVKDAVVEALTPYLAQAKNKEEAVMCAKANLGMLEQVADGVLKNAGYKYSSRAEVRQEYFPTRAYGEVVLSSGEYASLILNLGEGVGDNWWCVVYPPLCFVGTENSSQASVVYQSKLLEIIRNFLEDKR